MQGEFDRARELYRLSRPMLEDYGAVVLAASTCLTSGRVELLAGDLDAAESELRRDYDKLLSLGELYYRPCVAVWLAQTLYAQDRLDEAEELARSAAEIAAEDDIESQAVWRSVEAKILARRGDTRESVRLAREAAALLGKTDDILARSDALVDLAEVLRTVGDEGEALVALDGALELCRRKQITIQVERIEQMLDPLRPGSVSQRA